MPSRPAPTDRQLQEMAIEQMRLSVAERGKDNPLVGAVIVLPDGRVEGAHRAQFRNGHHAERSLLDGMFAHENISRARLFVTLEPCGPGSRSDREQPCTERIIDARIGEVSFGIQDPHRKVNGKGVAHLRREGIPVKEFDPDLQEVIRAENADWLTNAIEEAAREQATAPGLHPLVQVFDSGRTKTTVADLSSKALTAYRRAKGIRGSNTSSESLEHLYRLGALDGPGIDAHATGLGVILFAPDPRPAVPSAGLNAVIHVSDDLEITKRFDMPAVLIPAEVDSWLRSNIPDAESRDRPVRAKVERLPYRAIREAIVNALVHRDYQKNAVCHLEVYDDRIVIKSPGGPVPPLAIEDLSTLRAGVHYRNIGLILAFADADLMEQQNLGMKTFRALPSEGYPLPTYSQDGQFLAITIFRTATAAAGSKIDVSSLSESHQKGASFLVLQESVSTSEYVEAIGVSRATAFRHLTLFVELGLLEAPRAGGRAARYRVFR